MAEDLEARSQRFIWGAAAEGAADTFFDEIPRLLHFIWLGGEMPARFARQASPPPILPSPTQLPLAGWLSRSEPAA